MSAYLICTKPYEVSFITVRFISYKGLLLYRKEDLKQSQDWDSDRMALDPVVLAAIC